MNLKQTSGLVFGLIAAALLAACGGGGSGGTGGGGGPAPTYSVGGAVSGLNGTLVLQNNGGDDLTLTANGNFTFVTPVAFGSTYTVTVLTQPVAQSCSIANDTGTMGAANVANVTITCNSLTYTVGGTVSGLNGSLVLQNNGGDNLNIAANGTFNFATALNSASAYSVSILSSAVGFQQCGVTNASGTIAAANISDVGVACHNTQMGGGLLGNDMHLAGTASCVAGAGCYNNSYINPLLNAGFANNVGTSAKFYEPTGVTTDGINLYVADRVNHLVRKVVIATGAATTLAGQTGVAGNADATGTLATFTYPYAVTTDGTFVYVADGAHLIRRIEIATGVVTTIAGQAGICTYVDGTGTAATFCNPHGLTTDGVNLYVADSGNHVIRKIVLGTGVVSTVAGNGTLGYLDANGISAQLNSPQGITMDGANLYVTDANNQRIRKVALATGDVTTISGSGTQGSVDGTAASAQFDIPLGIVTDGVNLYIVEYAASTVRKVVIATGDVTTIAGSAYSPGSQMGTGSNATFDHPIGLTSDGSSLYLTNTSMHCIERLQ